MKETVKCQACGHEWNQRSESPTRQCPECHTRNWERIDSLGAVVSSIVSGAVVSDNEAVVTPAVVTLKTKAVAGWRDSVAAPGAYKVCAAHGMRYCKPCESEKPMKGTGRWCPECDWRAKPSSEQSELAQFSRHSASHNPSAAAWTDAHNLIQSQKPKKEARG